MVAGAHPLGGVALKLAFGWATAKTAAKPINPKMENSFFKLNKGRD